MIVNLSKFNTTNYRNSYSTSVISFRATNSTGTIALTDEEALKIIRTKGVNLYAIRPETNNPLIHDLAENDCYEAISELLLSPEQAKKMVDLRGAENKTPIMNARSSRVANLFAQKGANLELEDNYGNRGVDNPNLSNEYKKNIPARIPSGENAIVVAEKAKVVVPQNTDISEPSCLNTFDVKPSVKKIIPELEPYHTFKFENGDPKSLNDVVGLSDIKKEVKASIIIPNQNVASAKLKENHITLPNGILLVSPKGGGTTHLVKAISVEAGMPVIELTDLSKFNEIVSLLEKNYDTNNQQRAILYIKGIDKLTDSQAKPDFILQVERNLNNAAKRGFLTIATAECKDSVNKSLLVAGKLDKIFKMELPEINERNQFITKYLTDKKIFIGINDDINIAEISKMTSGFSFEQLKFILDEVARKSTSEDSGVSIEKLTSELKNFSKEQEIPEINEYNKTSMYDTFAKRHQYGPQDPKGFKDVYGMSDLKEKLNKDIVKPWKNIKKTSEFELINPDGIILHGPTGTGKTFNALALAYELETPAYIFDMSKLGDSLVHQTSKNIGELIDQLQNKYLKTGEMSVLIINEGDSVGQKSANSSEHQKETLNMILEKLDGTGEKGIIPVITTNNAESINSALLRRGRVGHSYYVGFQDFEGSLDTVKKFLAANPSRTKFAQDILTNEEKLNRLAKDFTDMPSSSIINVLTDGFRDAILNDKKLEDGIQTGFDAQKQRDLEDYLSKAAKNFGREMKVDKNSTIMYDTKYPRMEISEHISKTLEEFPGALDIKNQVYDEIINMFSPESIKRFKENKMSIPAGAIIDGESNGGKTSLVYTIANHMELPVYEVRRGIQGSCYVDEVEHNLTDLWQQCGYKYKKTGEMSIVMVNEIETWLPNRAGGNFAGHTAKETNEFLNLLEKASDHGIILLGTTNHYDAIDPAFFQNNSRLKSRLTLGLPDEASRMDIIKKTLSGKKIAETISEENIKELAEHFNKKALGDIIGTINNALINAIKKGENLQVNDIVRLIK